MALTYVIYTHKCNLHCDHCDIRLRPDNFDLNSFLSKYQDIDTDIVLFGGEPLLKFDLLKTLLENNRNVTSISSNMLLWDNNYKSLLENYPKVHISSSWNPGRFTQEQYLLWLKNLNDSQLVTEINITLTKDLFELPEDAIINLFSDLDKINSLQFIAFEPLVPDYNSAEGDEFLCKIYDKIKNFRIKLDLNKIFGKKYCGGIKTLLPNGNLVDGCPQWYVENRKMQKECFDCKLLPICKPCKKIIGCSFPKNFYNKLKLENSI